MRKYNSLKREWGLLRGDLKQIKSQSALSYSSPEKIINLVEKILEPVQDLMSSHRSQNFERKW